MDKVTTKFDDDSKRFYPFIIDEDKGILETLYIPKGTQVPNEVIIALRKKNSSKNE